MLVFPLSLKKNKVIDEKETFTNTKQIYSEGKEWHSEGISTDID